MLYLFCDVWELFMLRKIRKHFKNILYVAGLQGRWQAGNHTRLWSQKLNQYTLTLLLCIQFDETLLLFLLYQTIFFSRCISEGNFFWDMDKSGISSYCYSPLAWVIIKVLIIISTVGVYKWRSSFWSDFETWKVNKVTGK